MKINVSLDDKLVQRIDDYADANYMSRSGLISFATTQFLNQADMVRCINDMGLAMRKIADTGKVDHDTMEQLEEFERIAQYFTLKK